MQGEKKIQVREEIVGMVVEKGVTCRDVIEAWEKFPKTGRISFLLRSRYMEFKFPEDNEQFIQVLDRFVKAEFAGLPGDLQNEFASFMDTPNYQIWVKKGG